MVSKGKQRFPLLGTVFFAAVAAWAAGRGWKGLAAYAESRSSGTSNGEPEEGSPEAAEEELSERKKRNKKVLTGVLVTTALVAAGIAAGFVTVVYIQYLFNNLDTGVALGLVGGKILIYGGIRAVYKHTPLPGAIALALASSLSNALFGLVTTHVLGHSMQFPVFGLDWNYVLLLLSIASWILAINFTLWRTKALSTITALTITVALLLLAYPATNFLYSDIKWNDPIAALTASFPTAEARPVPEQSDDKAEPIALGYWIESSAEEPGTSYVNLKVPYVISVESYYDASLILGLVSSGGIYITDSDDRIVACLPYSTPDNFKDSNYLLFDLDPAYFTVQDEVATIRLRLWSQATLDDCILHFGPGKNDFITEMSTLPVLAQGA